MHTATYCLLTVIIMAHFNLGEKSTKVMFTEHLSRGTIAEVRKLSKVIGLHANVVSYAGYFTVNETCSSNLFFWFFPSENNPSTDPVAVWLQGGPGSTSLDGLFTEIGPFKVTRNLTLELREFPWNKNASYIFIDNPVGTGLSYANTSCYATDQEQVGQELLIALEQFFQVFSEYKDNDLFITGQSFAGHYIPAIAYAIHASNSTLNLKGIAIGNGLIDIRNQFEYSQHLFQLGLIDNMVRKKIASAERKVKKHIECGDYLAASQLWDSILEIIEFVTGFENFFNFLHSEIDEADKNYVQFINKPEVMRAIHVDRELTAISDEVHRHLYEDMTRPYASWMKVILNNYRVLLYSGQLDMMVPYSSTVQYIEKLKWNNSKLYKKAIRDKFYVNGSLAGYVKSSGDFSEVMIRNAGHSVPLDQPEWAFTMINKFFRNESIAS